MLNHVLRIVRRFTSSSQINACSMCTALHVDAGPFVEGPGGFLACSSCVRALADSAVAIDPNRNLDLIPHDNPYAPPVSGLRRSCSLCGDHIVDGTLHAVDDRYSVCPTCIATSTDLLARN